MLLQNPKRPPGHRAPLRRVARGGRHSILSFTLEGMQQHAPDLWIPKNFTDGVGPHQSALTNIPLDMAAAIMWGYNSAESAMVFSGFFVEARGANEMGTFKEPLPPNPSGF